MEEWKNIVDASGKASAKDVTLRISLESGEKNKSVKKTEQSKLLQLQPEIGLRYFRL